MASFGKHLHAPQNSKLAKYAESANFAYLSNQTPSGFDLSKGPNQKTFGTQRHNKCLLNKRQGASTFQKVRTKKPSAPKGTTSANQTPRGLDLSKGLNQKTFGTKGTTSPRPRGSGLFQKARIKTFGTKTQ
jgi:hypothetical protein